VRVEEEEEEEVNELAPLLISPSSVFSTDA
jgi:hypothetical protein